MKLTERHQPATRHVVVFGAGDCVQRHVIRFKSLALLPAFCCRRRRRARNLTAQVYYDGTYFWCRQGTGCKKKEHSK